jgi:hypothetical protein
MTGRLVNILNRLPRWPTASAAALMGFGLSGLAVTARVAWDIPAADRQLRKNALAVLAFWLVVAGAGALHLRSALASRRRLARAKGGLCPTCGYNLTGNTSGVCPECGHSRAAPRVAG